MVDLMSFLNLTSSSSEPMAMEDKPFAWEMDGSVSSESSILNADSPIDAVSSCSTQARPAFEFCILKSGTSSELGEPAGLITRQLFPLAKSVPQPPAVASPSSSTSKMHYVDISFSQTDAQMDLRVLHQQQKQYHEQQSKQVKKSRRGPRSRSSEYRGVTFYRRTGRWESHIWHSGKQMYLGGFDTAHAAARAYDRAAIKFRGFGADINFNPGDYEEDLKQTKNLSKEEFVQMLRRESTGYSRRSSKFGGVTLNKCGVWEARMGMFLGKKAYDKATVNYNGKEAVTYGGELLFDLDAEGHHDVDLNLRISQPAVLNE